MKCENRFKSATDEIIVWQIPSLLPLENINQDLFFVSSLLPIIAWLTCQKIDDLSGWTLARETNLLRASARSSA
jgi:hypothetical protein